MSARLRSKNERMMLDLLDQIKNLPSDVSSNEYDSMQNFDSSSSNTESSDESMSDGLAELLEIKSDSVKLARGRSCKKDEYEWIPRAELDKMISSGEVNQITEKKNSDNQLEQDNSKNNPMTYAKRIDHCNFMNIEKIRSIQLRVPSGVVGLIVGPKGVTVKRIQQMTNTFIITPSREMDPVFEITGLTGNVEAARYEIELHLNNRTRFGLMDRDVEFARNGIEMVELDPEISASDIVAGQTDKSIAALQLISRLNPVEKMKLNGVLQSLNGNKTRSNRELTPSPPLRRQLTPSPPLFGSQAKPAPFSLHDSPPRMPQVRPPLFGNPRGYYQHPVYPPGVDQKFRPDRFVRPYSDMNQNISFVQTRCPFNDRNFHVMPFVNNSDMNMPVTTGISTMNTVVTGIHKAPPNCPIIRPVLTSTDEKENKLPAVIQADHFTELPSMESAADVATLESIDLTSITSCLQSALVLHPSQSTLNPTASEWMPRFGSVSEDHSDNGLDLDEALPLETVSTEFDKSSTGPSENVETLCNLCPTGKALFCYNCSINLSTLPGEKGFLTTIKTPQIRSPNCPKC